MIASFARAHGKDNTAMITPAMAAHVSDQLWLLEQTSV